MDGGGSGTSGSATRATGAGLAAAQLAADREEAEEKKWFPRPGQAEFMDLVRAVRELAGTDTDAQKAELARIKGFALRKHLGADD